MTSVSADTFTVFKPILLFVKCFGLAPFSVSGVLGSRHMRTSVFDVVYAVLVLMVVFSYLVVFHCNLWHTVVGVSICSVNQRVIALSTIFQFMLSAFICLVKRYKIIDIANQLAGLNVSLKRSCGCVWKRICRVLMVHLFISLLSVGSCFLSDMFVHIQDSSTLSFIISNVLNFACFLTEFQIVAFFMLLKQLTSDLNNSIRGLGRINGNKEDPCSCFKKLPLNSTAPIFVTSAYEKLQNNTTDISDSVSRSTKVIFLRDVQDSLCRASEILNSVYSFLLLYTSAKTFICLTHSLYFILLRMFVQDWSTCDKVSPYSYYMWFLHYAIKLVWLVFYSNSTIQQVSCTSVVSCAEYFITVFKTHLVIEPN